MKRDMDLVREILLKMEADNSVEYITGYSTEQVEHHVHLMVEAGLLKGAPITAVGDRYQRALALGMTWQGHDFLDAARSETIWERAKRAITAQGGGLAIDVLKAVLTKFATDAAIGSPSP